MKVMQLKKPTNSLFSIKALFGVGDSEHDENLPVLVQAGMECMNIQIADSIGQELTPEGVESSVVDAFDSIQSTYDSVAVALVSMAAVVASVPMPPASRASIESIIHLNISKLEEKLS